MGHLPVTTSNPEESRAMATTVECVAEADSSSIHPDVYKSWMKRCAEQIRLMADRIERLESYWSEPDWWWRW